jgi:ribose-phosphate pyrophosphokinase
MSESLQEIESLVKRLIQTNRHPIKIFGLSGSRQFAERLVAHLNMKLTPSEEHVFADDEFYVKPSGDPIGNVRGHTCFVIQSLYSDRSQSVSDRFMRLAFMCGALRQAKAHQIIAVIPHYAWNRLDRKIKSRDLIATKVVAAMLESVTVDQCLFTDVHSLAATQNSFDLRHTPDILESTNLFVDWAATRLMEEVLKPGDNQRIVMLSPDSSGFGRCVAFGESLHAALAEYGYEVVVDAAVLTKVRKDGKIVPGLYKVIGDMEDSVVLVWDDMFSTFGTSSQAYHAARSEGGRVFAIMAPHGLFAGKANNLLHEIDAHICVSDTVSPEGRLDDENFKKVSQISVTKLMADAIWRIHSTTGSISDLLIRRPSKR